MDHDSISPDHVFVLLTTVVDPMTGPVWNGRLIVALVIMISYLWGHSRLVDMDERFFVPSPGGLRALTLYLTGDYAAAGSAYLNLSGSRAVSAARVPSNHRDVLIDALVDSAIRQAREGATGQSVRTMHRVLWLDPPFRGSATTLYKVVTAAGSLMKVPTHQRSSALLAATCAYLQQRDPNHGCPARSYAQEAIAKGELVPESYVTLSISLSDAGNFVESRAAVRKALAIDARHPTALVWAATQARRQNDVVAEHRYLWAAWTATSHDPDVGETLQRLLTTLGDQHGLNKLAREHKAE